VPSVPLRVPQICLRQFAYPGLQNPLGIEGSSLFSRWEDGLHAGVDEMTVPDAKGGLVPVHTRGISIWRRDPDGEWRCVIDIANEAPAA
jgi:hypothetical protein